MRRLALTHERSFLLPRQAIEVESHDAELLDWLSSRVPRAPQDAPTDRRFRITSGHDDRYVFAETGRDSPFRGSRRDVATRLLERFNELACFTSPALTVHSGLVADALGRSIWIPADSGGGKSTLTAQLTLRGMRYGTDEVVTIDDGRLDGWSKWLCLKQGSHGVLSPLRPDPSDLLAGGRRWMVPPAAMGAVLEHSVDPWMIAFPSFDRAALQTEVVPVTKAEAVASIVPQVFNLRELGAAGFDELASVVSRARTCVRVTYVDGWDAADALTEILGSSGSSAPRAASAQT